MSPRQITRIIRKLEKTGEISVQRREGGTHMLTVKMTHDKLSPLTQLCHPTPDIAVSPTPDIAMSPEPSLTVNKPLLSAKPADDIKEESASLPPDEKPSISTEEPRPSIAARPTATVSLKEDENHRSEEHISFDELEREMRGAPPKGRTAEIARAVANVCHQDFRLNRGKYMAAAKHLLATFKDATPDLIDKYYGKEGWWYAHHWKGLRDQVPNIADINGTWNHWDVPKSIEAKVDMYTQEEIYG